MTTAQRLIGAASFLALVAFLPSVVLLAAEPEADLVIYNGKILTADSPDPSNFRTAQAAAIRNGKFQIVGTNDEVLQYAGPNTQKIDLGGRTVLPGLIDTHDHIHEYAEHFFAEPRSDEDPALAWNSKDEGLARGRWL